MKKLPFILCFIIASFGTHAQMANIPVTITYNPILDKLDTIEDKLLAHIEDICSKKVQCDLTLFLVHYLYKDTWSIPLTISESCNSIPHKDILRSNDYRLDVKWDANLDTGYVIGFSREYYIKRLGDNQNQWDIAGGMVAAKDLPLLSKVYLSPLYEVPLCQYNKLLTHTEIEYLNGTIENLFVNNITDFDSYYNGAEYAENTSFRYVQLDKTDSLAQMPWSQWTWRILGCLKNGELHTYKKSSCKDDVFSSEQLRQDLEAVEMIYDSNGNGTVGGGIAIEFNSIIVAEKWSFDTLSTGSYFIKGALAISRKIEAIGFIPDIPKGLEQKGHSTIWVKYDDLERVLKEQGSQYDLYNLLLSSTLFRKLGMFYK